MTSVYAAKYVLTENFELSRSILSPRENMPIWMGKRAPFLRAQLIICESFNIFLEILISTSEGMYNMPQKV